jgi:hypothetical protein
MKYDEKDLAEMMTYKRCADSNGEKMFISKYIDSVHRMKKDKFGNRFKVVGNSDTVFTCHTDTVHRYSSYNDQSADENRQDVFIKKNWAYTDGQTILGGDDTAGCFVCLNMIYAGVPGLYIFHREEESGGRGSNSIAKTMMLQGYKKVISLDRKGYTDVITHQGRTETCSLEFATELARRLGGGFRPCNGGVFTDSANYVSICPECTNLSVGYFNGHTVEEIQDLAFAKKLAAKMININWATLPVVRQIVKDVPNSFDSYNYGYKVGNYKNRKDYYWNKKDSEDNFGYW